MKKSIIVITATISLSMILTACNGYNKEVNNDTEEHHDKFSKLENNELTEEEIKEKYEEYGDMSWYSEENNKDENDTESDTKSNTEDNIPENWNEQYNNTFESNIDINLDKVNVDLSTYSWYTPVINSDFEYNINTHQWIAYAINEYYNENVTQTFSCEIPNDIIESQTNMIFTVLVHGSENNLEILLDLYNYQIVVSEV